MRFNAMGFKFTRHQSPEKMAAVIFIFSKEGGQQKSYLVIHFYKANLSRRIEKKALFSLWMRSLQCARQSSLFKCKVSVKTKMKGGPSKCRAKK